MAATPFSRLNRVGQSVTPTTPRDVRRIRSAMTVSHHRISVHALHLSLTCASNCNIPFIYH